MKNNRETCFVCIIQNNSTSRFPGSNGTRGGSDVPGYGGDILNIREKYGRVGDKLSTHYIYHQASRNLYQYTPWENSIYIRNIKLKTEGSEVKVQNGLNFIIRK